MAVQGTYGRGQMLGATVDPRLFMQDYSGFAKAGAIQGQALSDLGGQIGGAIEKTADIFKERKKLDASIKANRASIESALKLGESLGIDVSSLNPILEKMDDPNTPLTESALLGDMAAKQITNVLNMGITASERESAQQRAMMEQQYKAAQLGMKAEEIGLQRQKAAREASAVKSEEIPVVNASTGEKDSVLIDRDSQGRMRDPESGKIIKDLFKYANEMEGWEAPDQPEMPPTSQVGSGGLINESALSAPLRQYKQAFEEYGNKYGVDPALLAAISEHETGGGKSSAFRNKNNAMGVSNSSGPVKMGSVEASIEKMAILLGRGMNEGKGPYANVKSIEDIGRRYAPIGAENDPRSLNKFWSKGVKSKYEKLSQSQQIDNSLSMGGDMSQQAMGTPEQQAMIASMIEGNQGLATAQNAPQGTMATEPSIATQQPQLPQQTTQPVNRRLLSSKKGKFRTFTAEEEQQYGSKGQVNTETGEIRLIRPPSGMEIVTENGRTTYRQGPGVTGKVERAEQAAQKQSVQQLRAIASATESAIPLIERASTNPLAAKGEVLIGELLGASEEGRLASAIETINIQNSLATINEQRKASVTGGIGGNITEKEWPRWENRVGKIKPGMFRDDLKKNVQLSLLNQFEAVNGEPKDVIKLLQDKKIDQSQFNEYVEAYDSIRASAKIPLNGVGGKADSWTAYDTNLRKFYKGTGSTQGQPTPSGTMDKIQEMRSRLNKY